MISLRPLEPEDLDLLYRIENAPEAWTIGLPGTCYSRFELKNYIASQTYDLVGQGQLRQTIVCDGRAIGIIDLFNYEPIAQRAEVGIALLESERLQGAGGAALRLLCEQASQSLHLHQLVAKISHRTHAACKAIFEENAFRAVATLPDWSFAEGSYVDVWLYSRIF